MLTNEQRDQFTAETALRKDVDIDELSEMPAQSYADIMRNADELVKRKNNPIYAKYKDGEEICI